jgi:hypothetical protein
VVSKGRSVLVCVRGEAVVAEEDGKVRQDAAGSFLFFSFKGSTEREVEDRSFLMQSMRQDISRSV